MNLDRALRLSYLESFPADAAAVLERLPESELAAQLKGIKATVLTRCLDAMTTSRATAAFRVLTPAKRREVMSAAPPRLATSILRGLDDSEKAALLESLPAAIREDLDRLQRFDPEAAGSLLDRPYGTIRTGMTVGEALAVLRDSGARRVRSVYVVDTGNRLVGKADMQSMAMASPDDRMATLVEPLEGVVLATAPRREVVEQLEKFRVDSLPVVDIEGKLLGIVRHQRIFQVIESQATADIQKMVGASEDERALSTPMFSVKRRLPWLHINLLTAFLAAAVVGLFESLIAQFTALAVLLPVVAGQSGNAGSQALAVTMRGLALREIGTREWKQVLSKETQVGLIDGLALAVTCGLAVFVWSQSAGLAIVIAVAMVMSMVAAGISGALVPIVLTRIGQDPATAASIILTTVTDVAGFISFLGTATLLSFML